MTAAERPDHAPDPERHVAQADACWVSGCVPAEARCVPDVRHAIMGLLERYGASSTLLGRVGLAVTEAATNVVLHAYPGQEFPGGLRYEADIENGDLEIVIADDGDGLRDDHESDGLGLGLQIVASVSDDFAIKAGPAGLEVWLRFIVDRHED